MTCDVPLKAPYFDDLRVDSTFKDGGVYRQRRFLMGKENEFIVNEKVTAAAANKTGSTVWLDGFRRKGNYEKKLTTLARELVERLLPYFITEDYKCPDISCADPRSIAGTGIAPKLICLLAQTLPRSVTRLIRPGLGRRVA
jgi:hypothetical protein